MSSRSCSARSRLFLPFLTFGPSRRLTYWRSNTAFQGLMASSSGLICSSSVVLEHAGVFRRLVAVVLEDVPAAEHDVVEVGEGDEVLDQRGAPVGPLAEADRAHLGHRPDGAGDALANGQNAGDEGGGDGPEADAHHAEFSLRLGDINWFFHGVELYHAVISPAGTGIPAPRRLRADRLAVTDRQVGIPRRRSGPRVQPGVGQAEIPPARAHEAAWNRPSRLRCARRR